MIIFGPILYWKIKYVSRLQYLWKDIKKGEIEIPEFVQKHDDILERRSLTDYGIEPEPLHLSGVPTPSYMFWRNEDRWTVRELNFCVSLPCVLFQVVRTDLYLKVMAVQDQMFLGETVRTHALSIKMWIGESSKQISLPVSRSTAAARRLDEVGFDNLACIVSGLQYVKPGTFESVGTLELQNAGKAGLVTIQGKISAVLGTILVCALLFVTFLHDQAEKILDLFPSPPTS